MTLAVGGTLNPNTTTLGGCYRAKLGMTDVLHASYEPQHDKPTIWILTRSDTNQAVQPLEMTRGLKFCI